MPDQHGDDTPQSLTIEPETIKKDNRAQTRHETALSQIEDATYAILRKHQKQSV